MRLVIGHWKDHLPTRVGSIRNQRSIEQRIRDALASEQDAISLSNQLFSPHGLFKQLTTGEVERRNIVATPLFKEAQRQLSVLKRKEAHEFARTVEQFEARRGGSPSLHAMKRVQEAAGWYAIGFA